MSESDFWVDTEGLQRGAAGFRTKGDQVQDLAGRIRELLSPSTIYAAAGSDKGGLAFAQSHVEAGNQLYEAVHTWGTAVGSTGDAVTGMSKVFSGIEDGAVDAVGQLRSAITDSAGAPDGDLAPATDREIVPLQPREASTPVVHTTPQLATLREVAPVQPRR